MYAFLVDSGADPGRNLTVSKQTPVREHDKKQSPTLLFLIIVKKNTHYKNFNRQDEGETRSVIDII